MSMDVGERMKCLAEIARASGDYQSPRPPSITWIDAELDPAKVGYFQAEAAFAREDRMCSSITAKGTTPEEALDALVAEVSEELDRQMAKAEKAAEEATARRRITNHMLYALATAK